MSIASRLLTTPQGSIALLETSGTGLPLLMLHGLGASKEVFSHQLESPLGDLHRMIAIDLPGHGGSSRATDPEIDYTLPAIAATAATVLRELGIERAVVFGWSLGGHIAIQMMAAFPELLAGVMLTGAPPFGHGTINAFRAFHLSWDALLASKETYSQRDAERFERLCFGAEAGGKYVDTIMAADGRMRAIVNRSLMRGDGADQKRVVELSDIPIAMVNGTDEPIAKLGYMAGVRYRDLFEGHTHVVADAGHAPFLTAPHAFNALLHRFVTHVALREREAPRRRPLPEIARSA